MGRRGLVNMRDWNGTRIAPSVVWKVTAQKIEKYQTSDERDQR